ncbi:MAG: phage shock protein PspA [Gammaproteobacteria bacterium]|nr:phage shock protein PspA [Gammaproteobacteria bacterium]
MSVFSRMSDIVNSNINAILDKAEDPAKMVRLIIQEMEETLVEVRSTTARTIADRKELRRKIEYQSAEVDSWEEKAELAIRKGREDLARGALLEKQRAAKFVDSLNSELQLVEESLEKMQEDIQTLSTKLVDAKARQAAIVVRSKTAKARLGVRRQLSQRNVDDAMVRFEQYERKMDDLEGEVESYNVEQQSLAEQIDELDDSVEAELESLKSKMSKTRDSQA